MYLAQVTYSLFGILFSIDCIIRGIRSYCMREIQDCIKYLNEIVDERFPNTTRYIICGGDSIKDVVLELRQENKKLRFSLYGLFIKSNNYKDTIEQFVKQWEKIQEAP